MSIGKFRRSKILSRIVRALFPLALVPLIYRYVGQTDELLALIAVIAWVPMAEILLFARELERYEMRRARKWPPPESDASN
jgi:uncharacterized membrane protein YkvA (DUF1232 family)